MSDYKQMHAGDDVLIEKDTAAALVCCDCGLVHIADWRINKNGDLVMRFWRDEEATEQHREDAEIESAIKDNVCHLIF
jgi:hypothetical protein